MHLDVEVSPAVTILNQLLHEKHQPLGYIECSGFASMGLSVPNKFSGISSKFSEGFHNG